MCNGSRGWSGSPIKQKAGGSITSSSGPCAKVSSDSRGVSRLTFQLYSLNTPKKWKAALIFWCSLGNKDIKTRLSSWLHIPLMENPLFLYSASSSSSCWDKQDVWQVTMKLCPWRQRVKLRNGRFLFSCWCWGLKRRFPRRIIFTHDGGVRWYQWESGRASHPENYAISVSAAAVWGFKPEGKNLLVWRGVLVSHGRDPAFLAFVPLQERSQDTDDRLQC